MYYIEKVRNGNDFFGKMLKELENVEEIGLDIETTSLDPFNFELILLQLNINDNIYVINCRTIEPENLDYILALINDLRIEVIGHNIKFDAKMLYQKFTERFRYLYDTMIAEVLINQGVGKQYYSYKELAKKYCNAEIDKDVRETFINFNGNITNEQINYSALDVKYLPEIKAKQLERLAGQRQLKILEEEMELIWPVIDLELNGVQINSNGWTSTVKEKEIKLAEAEKVIKEKVIGELNKNEYENLYDASQVLAIPVKTKKLTRELESIKDSKYGTSWLKENFNVNSHVQMLKALNLLGVPVESTGEKVLQPFRKQYEIVNDLLNLREYEKLVSTYGLNVLNEIHPITERFHPDYNQVGTVTGRFTVSRVHQMPRSNEYRNHFIAREGWKIITADYSQQEFRLLGAYTQDPKIIEAYVRGSDIHAATATILYGIDLKDVTPDQRYNGKTVNFALGYGASPWGLAYNLKISKGEAEELFKALHEGYKVMFEVKEHTENLIVEKGFSVNPLGRKRFFEGREIFRDNFERDKYVRKIKKEGWNHIIQSWGADITKMAMNLIFYKNPWGDHLRFYLQVHDEIDTEVKEHLAKEAGEFVKECMIEVEQPFLGKIPAAVEYVIDSCWRK